MASDRRHLRYRVDYSVIKKHRNHMKNVTGKKQSLLKAWTGPEGSNRASLPDFKTIGT
jgi:hypothetical protein